MQGKQGFGRNSKKNYLCKNNKVMSFKDKFLKWWYFHLANPVVRKGESGGFKWRFRRFWLDIWTVSENFKVRFTADKDPYGYLLAGKDDTNIHGFAATMYNVGKLLTTDQGFVNDIQKAFDKYEKRLAKTELEDESGEEAAIAEVKAVQEYVDAPKKVQRKMERDANGRFKKAVKEVQKDES